MLELENTINSSFTKNNFCYKTFTAIFDTNITMYQFKQTLRHIKCIFEQYNMHFLKKDT